MMVKKKLDGTVDESSVDQEIRNPLRQCITCEKSGGLHLAEPGLMAVRYSYTEEIWAHLKF